ncbi:sirohydrochlorin chelatase [Coleofasciculus sp. E1-EBD-02]|uniref:sirohydrochlorin chelatase n=1 Tax=Coleofasciculus sp. E1-EBD-02 TaxID=3068481 RepID=UPI0032F8D4F5
MPSSSAYLLIAHGSRDPRPQRGLEELAQLLQKQLASQGEASQALRIRVGTATLELAPLSLHEQICQFATQAIKTGYPQIQALPLFLLPGVHVMEDIPEEVAIAQQRLGEKLTINLQPHIGVHPHLGQLLVNQQPPLNAPIKILISHGTRRPGGNQPVATLAQQLGAIDAYWSIEPTLSQRVATLAEAGYQHIAIVPYFLFAGGITDAIAQSVLDLQQQYPQLQLEFGEPLGATPQLAELILDLTRQRV